MGAWAMLVAYLAQRNLIALDPRLHSRFRDHPSASYPNVFPSEVS